MALVTWFNAVTIYREGGVKQQKPVRKIKNTFTYM